MEFTAACSRRGLHFELFFNFTFFHFLSIWSLHFKQQLKVSREFERAVLPVKGEIFDADGAGRAEDGGR